MDLRSRTYSLQLSVYTICDTSYILAALLRISTATTDLTNGVFISVGLNDLGLSPELKFGTSDIEFPVRSTEHVPIYVTKRFHIAAGFSLRPGNIRKGFRLKWVS
jgi:hypothetical protein